MCLDCVVFTVRHRQQQEDSVLQQRTGQGAVYTLHGSGHRVSTASRLPTLN